MFKDTLYQPKTPQEAQYGIDQMSKGYAKGYHEGLKEGYIKARYPEICHCSLCVSHGEMCKYIHATNN